MKKVKVGEARNIYQAGNATATAKHREKEADKGMKQITIFLDEETRALLESLYPQFGENKKIGRNEAIKCGLKLLKNNMKK
jgi:hypothetical protein